MGGSRGVRRATRRRPAVLRVGCAHAALGLLLLASCVAGRAADAVLPAPASSAVPLDAELVRTGLYLIRGGGGGNSLLRLTANGMVLVDGQPAGDHRALMRQVRRISKLSDMPVRVVVLTGPQERHSGDVAQFMAARVPILAQRDTLSALSLGESPLAAGGSPVVAYDDDYALRLGGVEVRLRHAGDPGSGGDTIVYFPDLRIVAVGDLFGSEAAALPVSAGAGLAQRARVLSQLLALDFDRVVPGSGPVVGRDELVAFEAKLAARVACADALASRRAARDATPSASSAADGDGGCPP